MTITCDNGDEYVVEGIMVRSPREISTNAELWIFNASTDVYFSEQNIPEPDPNNPPAEQLPEDQPVPNPPVTPKPEEEEIVPDIRILNRVVIWA